MSKNHLTKEDVEKLINCLKSYDNVVCELLKPGSITNDSEVKWAIEEHDKVEYLINTLNRK